MFLEYLTAQHLADRLSSLLSLQAGGNILQMFYLNQAGVSVVVTDTVSASRVVADASRVPAIVARSTILPCSVKPVSIKSVQLI